MGGDLAAVSDDDRDRVGEIELPLDIVRLDPLQRGPEHLGAEDVDRRVDLPDLPVLLVRIRALDDAQHRAVRAADDATVEPRVGRFRGEHRGCGSFAPVGGDELLEESGGEHRRVARQNEHVAVAPFEGGPRAPYGVAGAERRLLHRDLDRARCKLVPGRGRRDDHDRIGPRRPAGLDDPVDHAAPEQLVKVLRDGRPHSRAETSGHDDGC